MQIALLGFGTVGTGVYKIIRSNVKMTRQFHITHILMRPGKTHCLPKIMTSDYQKIINDPHLDAVIEVMGGIEPAHKDIIAALKHHKNVVSANKEVIAKYLQEFQQTAKANHVKFYCEASVGGVIPWLFNLKRALRVNAVTKIQGILNGTSNYILSQMQQTGESFAQVLKRAQDLGYAEEDPSADIDGYDIENKLCITADFAENTFIKPSPKLPCFGIRNVRNQDIAFFKKLGFVIKLMGKLNFKHHAYEYAIEPTLFGDEHVMAHIRNNYNLIVMHGESSGTLSFGGQGAGQLPTAHAIIQDLLNIRQVKRSINYDFATELKFKPDANKKDYYLRSKVKLPQTIAKTLNDNYQEIDGVSTAKMHHMMVRILHKDSHAFMACLSK